MTDVHVEGPALGRFVAERLGVGWTVRADPYGLGLDALAGLALRRNPKRAQLIVSTVLAKHIAAPPAAVRAAGLLLAGLVQRALGGAVPELTGELLTDPGRS
ncbi:MAG: phosphoribosyl transferase family protein, partial [Aeromicrobium sp.]|nr:phosphoribosyl transferase family protein [Aeromicrobium sp.]